MDSSALLEENIALKNENKEMQATIAELSYNIKLLEEENRQLQLKIGKTNAASEKTGPQLTEDLTSLKVIQNHGANEYNLEINKLFLLKTCNLSAELFRKILGILNKLTVENFDILLGEIMELQIDAQDVPAVVTLIFEKAINEQIFSELYAKLCHQLVEKSKEKYQCEANSDNEKVGLHPSKMALFKKAMLDKTEREFHNNVIDLQAKDFKLKPNTERLKNCSDPKVRSEIESQLEEQEYKLRQRSCGTVRFIGELFKISMLTGNIIKTCVISLLDAKSEEKLECLCKLLRTVGKKLEQTPINNKEPTSLHSLEDVINKMQAIVDKKIEGGKISNRVRFMLQDIIDLRRNFWYVENIDPQVKIKNPDMQFDNQGRSQMPNKGPGTQFHYRRNRNANSRRSKMPIKDPDMQFDNQGRSQMPNKGPGTQFHYRRNRNANRHSKMPIKDPDMQFDNQGDCNDYNTPHSQMPIKGPGTQFHYPRNRNANRRHSKMPIKDPDMQFDNQGDRNDVNIPRSQMPIKGTESHYRRNSNASGRCFKVPTEDPDTETVDTNNQNQISNTEETVNLDDSVHSWALLCNIINEFLHLAETKLSTKILSVSIFDFIKPGNPNQTDIKRGYLEFCNVASEKIIETPNVWPDFFEFIGPLIHKNLFQIDIFWEDQLRESITGKHFLKSMFTYFIDNHGINYTKDLWINSKFKWQDFLQDNGIYDFIVESELQLNTTDSNDSDKKEIICRIEELLKEGADLYEIIYDICKSNECTWEKSFIHQLTTILCAHSLEKDNEDYIMKKEIFQKTCVPLLQRYIDSNEEFELECLKAIQGCVEDLKYPTELLFTIFSELLDLDVIPRETFLKWWSTCEKTTNTSVLEPFFNLLTSPIKDPDMQFDNQGDRNDVNIPRSQMPIKGTESHYRRNSNASGRCFKVPTEDPDTETVDTNNQNQISNTEETVNLDDSVHSWALLCNIINEFLHLAETKLSTKILSVSIFDFIKPGNPNQTDIKRGYLEFCNVASEKIIETPNVWPDFFEFIGPLIHKNLFQIDIFWEDQLRESITGKHFLKSMFTYFIDNHGINYTKDLWINSKFKWQDFLQDNGIYDFIVESELQLNTTDSNDSDKKEIICRIEELLKEGADLYEIIYDICKSNECTWEKSFIHQLTTILCAHSLEKDNEDYIMKKEIFQKTCVPLLQRYIDSNEEFELECLKAIQGCVEDLKYPTELLFTIFSELLDLDVIPRETFLKWWSTCEKTTNTSVLEPFFNLLTSPIKDPDMQFDNQGDRNDVNIPRSQMPIKGTESHYRRNSNASGRCFKVPTEDPDTETVDTNNQNQISNTEETVNLDDSVHSWALLCNIINEFLHLAETKLSTKILSVSIFDFIKPGNPNQTDIKRGYLEFCNVASEKIIETPNVWPDFFEFIGPLIHKNLFQIDIFWEDQLRESITGKHFLKSMFTYFIDNHGINYTKDLWINSKFKWQDFLQDNGIYDFIVESELQLNTTDSNDSDKKEIICRIEELLKEGADLYEIIYDICKSNECTWEKSFIHQLTTILCAHSLEKDNEDYIMKKEIFQKTCVPLLQRYIDSNEEFELECLKAIQGCVEDLKYPTELLFTIFSELLDLDVIPRETFLKWWSTCEKTTNTSVLEPFFNLLTSPIKDPDMQFDNQGDCNDYNTPHSQMPIKGPGTQFHYPRNRNANRRHSKMPIKDPDMQFDNQGDCNDYNTPHSQMPIKGPGTQFHYPRNRNANRRHSKMPIKDPDMQFDNQGNCNDYNTPHSQMPIKGPGTQFHYPRNRNANRRHSKMPIKDPDMQFDNQGDCNDYNTPHSQMPIKGPGTQFHYPRNRNANRRHSKMPIKDPDMQFDNQGDCNDYNTPHSQMPIKGPGTQFHYPRNRNANRRHSKMPIKDPDMQFDNQGDCNDYNTPHSQMPIKGPGTQFHYQRNRNANRRRSKMPIKDPDMQFDNQGDRNDVNIPRSQMPIKGTESHYRRNSNASGRCFKVPTEDPDTETVDTNNQNQISNTEETVNLDDSVHSWALLCNIINEFLHLAETKLSTKILSVSIFDFIKPGNPNQTDIKRGYLEFSNVAIQKIIETPNVWPDFFEFIGPLIHKNLFQIDIFWEDQLRESITGKHFLKSMFTYFIDNHGINYTKDLWINSKFKWQDFLQDNGIYDFIVESELQLNTTDSNDSDKKEIICRIEELLKEGADLYEIIYDICKSNECTWEKSFIHQLTTILCAHSLEKDNEDYIMKKEIFQKTCVPLLQRYIDSNEEFELECLKAIQGCVEDLKYPTELLFTIFSELLDLDVIPRETFLKWWSTCEKTTNTSVLEPFFNLLTSPIKDPDMQFDNQGDRNDVNIPRSQMPIKETESHYRRNSNASGRCFKVPTEDPDTETVDTNNQNQISNTEETVNLDDSVHSWALLCNIINEFLHLAETKLSTKILSVSIFDFIKPGNPNQTDIKRGYLEFCNVASEKIIETPNVWPDFFEFIGPLIHKNLFQIDIFWEDQLRESITGKHFLKSMFTYFIDNHGINYTKDLWINSKFKWQDFLQDNGIYDFIVESELQLNTTDSNDSDKKEIICRIEELLKEGADLYEIIYDICKSNECTWEKSFIHQLTTILCAHSLEKDNEDYIMKKEIFQKTCVPLLQRYIDSNEEFELECLKAIQGCVEDLKYPTELLFTIFSELLDLDVIPRETFLKWWSTCEKTTNTSVLEPFFNLLTSESRE